MSAVPVASDTAARLADQLRSAAAWLRLAADELDAGHIRDAADRARLGIFGADGVDQRIRDLE